MAAVSRAVRVSRGWRPVSSCWRGRSPRRRVSWASRRAAAGAVSWAVRASRAGPGMPVMAGWVSQARSGGGGGGRGGVGGGGAGGWGGGARGAGRPGVQGVVPVAVPAVRGDRQGGHLLVADLGPGGGGVGVEFGVHA